MRLFELGNQLKSRPIVYVDMDGVLADFFGEIARAHGVATWKNIKDDEKSIIQAAKKPGFFSGLPKMDNADRLMHGVMKLAGAYSILSSPLQSRVEASSEEKADWMRQHYDGAMEPTAVLFDHEKFKYARQPDGTPNILIDDYPVNTRLWNSHGGVAITYDDDHVEQALHQLRAVIQDPMKYVQDSPTAESITESVDSLFTRWDVLRYVKGLHHKYRLDDPVTQVKAWRLEHVPTSFCSSPEYLHQDDPYRREIDLDMEHIDGITLRDIMTKPAVCNAEGWVLDGNHRITRARELGLDRIPVLLPA